MRIENGVIKRIDVDGGGREGGRCAGVGLT